jgi:hypothetical protein
MKRTSDSKETETEAARIGEDGAGSLWFEEADLEDASDGGRPNDRLFIPATEWMRFVVTREINGGLLAPRFSPSERVWLLGGDMVPVSPAAASEEQLNTQGEHS